MSAHRAALSIAPLLFLASPLRAVQMSERQTLIHTLNRLTFGPRPGDADRLRRQGIEAFIMEQLRPENIPDSLDEQRLRTYKTLTMSAKELSRLYPIINEDMARLAETFDPDQVPNFELSKAKIIRSVFSRRQLQEIMVDFWFNHFNIYPLKDAYKIREEWFLIPYERDVIRPRVFGKFRDLLGAVAHSPAMLVYLDNYLSSVDARTGPFGPAAEMNGAGSVRLSVNENYSRELLELHTLGVDGGYAQKDVTELARILTGWTIREPDNTNGSGDFDFHFQGDMHAPGDKIVLGRTFAAGGQDEGERVLDMLARHPSTAHFISLKLCRRFLADDPPESLVQRVAQRFLKTEGDIRETLLAIFRSPEFYDRRYFRSKVKSPFEFIISALRATGTKFQDPTAVVVSLSEDQPPYLCMPPNGYPDRAESWINTGSLSHRFDLVRDLSKFTGSAGQLPSMNAAGLLPDIGIHDGAAALEKLISSLLSDEMAEGSKAALFEQLTDPDISSAAGGGKRNYDLDRIAALVLASPDFEAR